MITPEDLVRWVEKAPAQAPKGTTSSTKTAASAPDQFAETRMTKKIMLNFTVTRNNSRGEPKGKVSRTLLGMLKVCEVTESPTTNRKQQAKAGKVN